MTSSSSSAVRDCVIIGGGPAGLTAAIYLSRFHLDVIVFDAGTSRAGLIPLTRNLAGFPDGISGSDLLARMRGQAAHYGSQICEGEVETIEKAANGNFAVHTKSHTVIARTVLLATGVVNRRPRMIEDAVHDQALAEGLLRYCPICDGYEVTDKSIAVLGTGQRGFDEALFLRSFSTNITLVAEDRHDLCFQHIKQLVEADIHLTEQCSKIELLEGKIALHLPSEIATFDTLYPALGSDIRSELARSVGASMTDEGCLTTDSHQRTNVEGFYAAGDVVLGLDQISHAMGEGGVAATTIRNDLNARAPLRR